MKNIENVALLPLTVRPREFEPASSLIRRLAVRAGHQSVRTFLHTVPRCPTWLAGDLDRGFSVEVLSRMSGIELPLIREATPFPTENGTYLGGVQITQTDRPSNGRSSSRGRICPTCLLEDRECLGGPVECRPFRRFWWDLAEFEGCPRHCQPLIDACPSCMLPLRKYLMRPDLCLCGYDLTQAHAGERISNVAERPLLSILLGVPRPGWTMGMSLRSMAWLALRVGAIHVFGPSLKEISSLPSAERMELLAIGWSCLENGPDGFAQELSDSFEQGSAKSPNLAYGEVYRWLRRTDEPGLDTYRDVLLDHAQSNLRLEKDAEVFGTSIPAQSRVNGSAESPSSEPLLALSGGGNAEICELLHLSKPQLVRYLKVNDRDRLPSSRNRARFDVEGLESFLREVEEGKPHFDSAPKEMVQVMGMNFYARKWPEVVREVRRGNVPLSGILSNQKGLYRWLVDPTHVRDRLPKQSKGAGVITCKEASSRLGVPFQTLSALRNAGLLQYDKVMGPADRLTEGPTLASLEAFERDYVTARECARKCGRHVIPINQILSDGDVECVIPSNRDVVAVYDRASAERALQRVFGDRMRNSA